MVHKRRILLFVAQKVEDDLIVMKAISIRKEEQKKYYTFDAVLQEEKTEATVVEKTSDGQILTTKCSQTTRKLIITQKDITEESRLEEWCCSCFSICSCDGLISKFDCDSCQNISYVRIAMCLLKNM